MPRRSSASGRHERVRARGRRRLPHVLHLCARPRRPLGHVSVARSCAEGPQRGRDGPGSVVAPARRVRPALSDAVAGRGFFAVSALLFTASAAATIAWCASMAGLGEMPMPGGWTMSMAWMRMPGQTWLGAAAAFLGMWEVMMVAMMLPSLVPMLRRYREAVAWAGEARLGRRTLI